jgi:hypothetical protein
MCGDAAGSLTAHSFKAHSHLVTTVRLAPLER